MATFITPAGEIRKISPQNGTTFTADELHALVEGYLECVYLPDGRIMWINEEGKLQGLPLNMVATFLALDALQRGDVIVGNAVITSTVEVGEDA